MKTYQSTRSDFLNHLKVMGLIVLFLGFPLSIAAGVYQQTHYTSNAQVAGTQITTNDIQPRLSPPPPGCYYAIDYRRCPLTQQNSIACRAGENCCPPVLICPSITPPSTTITISPPILSITPPPGCYPIPCTIACPATNPNCCPSRYFCPSGTPPAITTTVTPFPTCFPRPPCLDFNPACKLPTPTMGFCPPFVTSSAQNTDSVTSQPQTQNSFLIYLNSFFRRFFNK